MTRPSIGALSHTQEGWDSDLNDNLDAIGSTPFPIAEYANKAALPAAGSYDRCIASTSDDGNLWISNGTTWLPFQRTDDYSAASHAFGAFARLVTRTELVAVGTGATVDSTIQFPAGCFRLGASAYVETQITGPTSVDMGDDGGVDPNLYGQLSALTVGGNIDMGDETADPTGYVGTAEGLRLTANGGNFTAGQVRVAIHYIEFGAPTS